MTLYEKYAIEKEKYLPVFKNMTISYNKSKNSITYKDGQGYSLIVSYSPDMKISGIAAQTNGAFDTGKKWTSLNKLFENLGSNIWYYDFSSSYNPYNQVTPPHLEAMENQGLFDVMMSTANEYIMQNNMDVWLGVKYTGYGYASTPVAVARKGKLHYNEYRHLCDDYSEYPYDSNILYTQKYFENQLSKDDDHYFQFALKSRLDLGRTDYLDVIQNKIHQDLEDIKEEYEKAFYYEEDIWFEFYMTFNDYNEKHATRAFENNGLYDISPFELHEKNVSWVEEIVEHGLSTKQICEYMPNAKPYVEEYEQKIKNKIELMELDEIENEV